MQSVTAQRFVSNIRVLRVDAGEAKGPVYARAMVEQHLFRDEQYYMNIDSHSLCVPGWDVEAIQQLLQCDSEKPVLTCYPLDYDIVTRQLPIDQPSTFLKFRDFHSRTGFPQQDPVRFRHSPTKPQPSLFWAAGFSFTLGTVVREVPFDPNLQYVFLGEEISMAARLFAAGYDTFAPMRNIIFHYTLRKTSTGAPRPTFWEQFYKRNGQCKVAEDVRAERKALERAGNARITALLKGLPIEAPYGASSVRTLDQFWEFVGLDFETRRHKRHAQLGLTLYATEQERYFKYGKETFV
jgi:hypothetical protein